MTIDSLDPPGREQSAQQRPRPPPTPAINVLIALNVLAYAAETWLSGGTPRPEVLVTLGANDAARVWAGEWWRLLASAFLHGGVLHIGLNMYSLWALGAWVEMQLGAVRTAGLYLGSALLGSLASVLWSSGGISVGASGAVFGFAGATFALSFFASPDDAPVMRRMRGQLVWIILMNLAFGVWSNATPGGIRIDNLAHLGGLLGGTLLGAALMSARVRGPLAPLTLVTSVAFALMATVGFALATRPPAGPRHDEARARDAIERNDREQTRDMLNTPVDVATDPGTLGMRYWQCRLLDLPQCAEESLALLLAQDPMPPVGEPRVDVERLVRVLLLLAEEHRRQGDFDVAARILGRLAYMFPDSATFANDHAWFLLCRGHLSDEELRTARNQAERARRLSAGGLGGLLGPSPAISHTYAEALAQSGRMDEATAVLEGVRRLGAARRWLLGARTMDEAWLRAEMDRMRAGLPPGDPESDGASPRR
ncbi:MAG: rhomboid family intramembrane serine protease [Deltaproteobacteria bacterium]|nr:rhomboid family intramembrane serine protease [Deltaproteobacteria bacterium]